MNRIFFFCCLFISLSIPLTSCKVNTKADLPANDWKFAYKSQACTSCLKHLGAQIPNDNSEWLRFEVLGDKYFKQAYSVGLSYTKSVDHNSRYFKNSDMEGGKAITNGCLLFFNSKTLDSIAKSAYKEYSKKINRTCR